MNFYSYLFAVPAIQKFMARKTFISTSVKPVDVGEIPSPGLTIIPSWRNMINPIADNCILVKDFWNCITNYTFSIDNLIPNSDEYTKWSPDFGPKIGIYYSKNQSFKLSTEMDKSYIINLKRLTGTYAKNNKTYPYYPEVMLYDQNYFLINANPVTFPREILKPYELDFAVGPILVYLKLKKIRERIKPSKNISYQLEMFQNQAQTEGCFRGIE